MIKQTILLLLLCWSFMACNNSEEEKTTTSTVRPVKFISVGNSNLKGQHSYTGLAKAQQQARLSFKVGGTINRIPVKVGDQVKRGQVLAILDATDYQISYTQSLANVQNAKAQIESAQAQVESAKTNYLTAQSNYQRFEKLYETNSISLSDFEQAKSSYQSAEAAYKAAQTQVTAAEASKNSSESMAKSASNQVNYTKITAPFSGIITAINVEANEVVGQGNPILEINSVGNPDIEIGVPENTISEIKNNQKVTVQFNSIGSQKFQGIVHEIGYSSSGTTYPVTIRLTDSDPRIRPGMPASATFTHAGNHGVDNALLVPASAVGEDGNGNFVYIIQSNNEQHFCKKQSVKVGSLNDAGFEIVSGLNNGDKVASAGLNVLREGMEVSLFQQ